MNQISKPTTTSNGVEYGTGSSRRIQSEGMILRKIRANAQKDPIIREPKTIIFFDIGQVAEEKNRLGVTWLDPTSEVV